MIWATNLDVDFSEVQDKFTNIMKSKVFMVKFNYSYKKLLCVRIKTSQTIKISFYDSDFIIDENTTVNIPFKLKNNMLYIQIENLNKSDQILIDLAIFPFDNPIGILMPDNAFTNIIYSFDNRYYVGFFASFKSLLDASTPKHISKLLFNLCIPLTDYNSFANKYREFSKKISNINNIINKNIVLITTDMIQDDILHTKCYRGGNHLLSIGNFSRLLIGKLFNYSKALYLDSDTIVQKDIYPIIKKINMDDFVLCGKSSNLTYKNIININNVEILKKINSDINIDTKIIYTGTIIFNCRKFREYYDNIIKLIKIHNETKDGVYKLFTMSILNIILYGKIASFDKYLNNVVDLGCKKDLSEKILASADVLDWSGINKPWFVNGYYKKYWDKFNLLFKCTETILPTANKNTVESNLVCQ